MKHNSATDCSTRYQLLPAEHTRHWLIPKQKPISATDLLSEALFLVVVHDDDLVPVLGDIVEADRLAQVHKVEDVLLETRATEPRRRVEKFLADPRIRA